MRYTTVIDISEMPDVYRNENTRLLYLHLALKAGWHDEDRDKAKISIRNLAADCGLTLSATRHAIAVLTKHDLLARDEDGTWKVRKWHLDKPPAPRPKKSEVAAAAGARAITEQADKDLKEYQQRVLQAVRASTREELETWLAELQAHRSLRHHGVYLNANQANIDWLTGILKK